MVLDYVDWLLSIVDNGQIQNYSNLLWRLYDTDFDVLRGEDMKEYTNGLYLRKRFIEASEASESSSERAFGSKNCSILELMVSLSESCERNGGDCRLGDRTSVWFWIMIDSLGLSDFDDKNYDDEAVSYILGRFLSRKYEKNGAGGLFTLQKCPKDARKMPIWGISCWFMNEFIGLI